MARWREALLVLGGLAVGLVAASSVNAAPPLIVAAPPSAQAPLPPPPIPRDLVVPAGVAPPAGPCTEALTVTRLNDNTLVSVKDHCDSQTVLVYTFDDHGVMKPAPQKMRFYYRF